jgi:hypothetical protein
MEQQIEVITKIFEMFPLISGQHEMGPSIEKHIYPLQPKNEHIFIYIIPKTDGMVMREASQ